MFSPTWDCEYIARTISPGHNKCHFGFTNKDIVVAFGIENPWIFSQIDNTRQKLGKAHVEKAETTAITFSADGKLVCTGHADGVFILWDVEGNKCTKYKHVNPEKILFISFLENPEKIVILDEKGVVSVATTVISQSCEVILQTSLYNLKSPITSFVQRSRNTFALTSKDVFLSLQVNRKMDLFFYSSVKENSINIVPKSFDLYPYQDNDQNKSLILYTDGKKAYLEKCPISIDNAAFLIPGEHPIEKCFFIDQEHIILLYNNNTASVFSIQDKRKVHTESGLPSIVDNTNVIFFENTLIYYNNAFVIPYKIDFRTERVSSFMME